MNASTTFNPASTIAVTKSHERALVRTLLFAMQWNQEDGPSIKTAGLVENLANEYSGHARDSLRQVAELLAGGVSVVDALEQTPDALNPGAVLALRLAHQTGSVKQALEVLIAPRDFLDGSRQDARSDTPSNVAQGSFHFFAAWIIVSFLMIFIVPTFEVMFDEFGIELPATMKWLIALSNYVANYFWLLFLFFVIVFFIERRLKGKRIWQRGVRQSTTQQVCSVVDLLAMVVRQGRPVSAGLATLANYHPSTSIRARLAKTVQTIEQGMRPWQALAGQGFVSPKQATALANLEPATNLEPDGNHLSSETSMQVRPTQAWMLHEIAQRQQRDEWWRNGIWLRVISMGSMIVMAMIVTLAAVAMFQSVYSMVEALA